MQDLLARIPGPSLAELRYYEALLTDQAGDVMRYMLNDTLHNQLDSVAAWALKLNTPAGDWYAADVYRNMGQGATTTSVINAIGTRYSGMIDVSVYNAQKTLFGLISSAQPDLNPASSLASYITGSGCVCPLLERACPVSTDRRSARHRSVPRRDETGVDEQVRAPSPQQSRRARPPYSGGAALAPLRVP